MTLIYLALSIAAALYCLGILFAVITQLSNLDNAKELLGLTILILLLLALPATWTVALVCTLGLLHFLITRAKTEEPMTIKQTIQKRQPAKTPHEILDAYYAGPSID